MGWHTGSLSHGLGDPGQTDHCSHKRQQVSRVENVEAQRTTGIRSDIAEDNKQKQTRTASGVNSNHLHDMHRQRYLFLGTLHFRTDWELFLPNQCLPALEWCSLYRLAISLKVACWQKPTEKPTRGWRRDSPLLAVRYLQPDSSQLMLPQLCIQQEPWYLCDKSLSSSSAPGKHCAQCWSYGQKLF